MAENSGEINSGSQFEAPKPPEDAQERLLERAIEQRQVSESTSTKKTPQFKPPTQAPPPALSTPQQQTSQSDSDAVSATPSTGLSAQDADLIEKEWVQRAKSIVAKTRDDPYRQKDEMSKVKAEYIKKRFDKTIPLDEPSKS